MARSGGSSRALVIAGGVLSILAAIFQINNGAVLMAYFLAPGAMPGWEVLPFLPGLWFDFWNILIPFIEGWRPAIEVFILGLSLLILGTLAMAGGISAMRGKRFGLSLVGAICSLASGLLGVLGVIFVALSKREFEGEDSK